MNKQFVSYKKAKSLALATFLLGLGIISIDGQFWPDIMIAAGIALAFKHFLLRKFYDTILTLLIFLGVYFSEKFDFDSTLYLPVLLITSAIFILTREYIEVKLLPEDQKEEDLNHEIEETDLNQK